MPLRFLHDDEAIVLKSKKAMKDGSRHRAKDRGLFLRDGIARGDVVVTLRKRSRRASAAVLAARSAPFVAIALAMKNVTASLVAANRAKVVAKQHGPKILRILANVVTWKRLFDNMANFAQATPA